MAGHIKPGKISRLTFQCSVNVALTFLMALMWMKWVLAQVLEYLQHKQEE